MAQLDQTDLRIQVNSAKAEFERARADFTRAEGLVDQGHVSRSEFDKLRAQLTAARSNLETAQQNLAYTGLRAPFSGQIARRHVDNFEEVGASQPIYTLHDLSAFSVKIAVPESVMIRIRRDRKRRVFARFDAISGKEFPLQLKEVATQADSETQTFEVTLTLPAVADHNILPGMSVTVRGERVVTERDAHGPPIVPAHAVLDDGQQRYVWILAEQDRTTGVVRRRNVTVGRLADEGLEITAGLNPGTRIVAAGMSKMRDGLRVRLNTGEAR